MAKNKQKWRKILLGVVFVLINIVVIILAAFSEFGNAENAAELVDVKMNGWLLIPATLCFIVATIANIYKYVITMRSSYVANKKPNRKEIWKHSWRVVMLGKYYDNITPAAVGGQPFQIYYMYKNTDLPHGKAASIPIVGMISTQVGFLIIALICFLFGGVAKDNPALMVMAWIGLLFYAFWPAMVVGISYFPKATVKFLNFFVKILAKLHIVKNRELALKKVEREVTEYAKATKIVLKSRKLVINVLILSIIYNAFIAMIPFFVLAAFGGNMDFWACFCTTVAILSAVYFVPTPGNAGAAEGTFFVVFSTLAKGYVFWAMLVWRLFSYYIYIIMGLVTYASINLEKGRGKKLNAEKSNQPEETEN